MWPILKHIGRILRELFPVNREPMQCPACGTPNGLRPVALDGHPEPHWKCSNCGIVFDGGAEPRI